MRLPVILSFAWCFGLTLLGSDPVVMFLTLIVMIMIAGIAK